MHCALYCRTIVFSPGINQLREAFRKTADKGLSLTRPRLAFFLLSLLDIAPNKVVGCIIQKRYIMTIAQISRVKLLEVAEMKASLGGLVWPFFPFFIGLGKTFWMHFFCGKCKGECLNLHTCTKFQFHEVGGFFEHFGILERPFFVI